MKGYEILNKVYKEFGFTAGMLKCTLAEARRKN